MAFHDIKGHDNITLFFKRALNLKRVSHSYLFFGPDGVGKTLLAATLAKALNCVELPDDSCDKCASCVRIDNNNHPDVVWVGVNEKKDAIAIEQIRELQRQINLKPYESRTKIFVIKEAHLMSEAAANCLLKTIEEPPRNSIIILITSMIEEILPTIKSRCKQIRFGPLGARFRIELAEKMGLLKEEALFLSKLDNASISSLSELEIEGLFDYKNKVLDEFNSSANLLEEGSFIFSASKKGMKFIISILESWFRDILVLKTGVASLPLINSDRSGEIKGLTGRFSFGELEEIIKKIEDTNFYIERNVGPKLAFNNLKLMLWEKTKSA